MTPPRFQDAVTLLLAALVAWAVLQLAEPYGLPGWVMAGVGLCAGFGLAAWHLVGREPRGEDAGAGGYDVPGTGRTAMWILAALVVAALLLRVHGLLRGPAWEDEMWTLRNIYTSSWPELFRVAFEDYWPPLHYVILNALARVADTSLLSLRGPSVVFGVAAVAAMYPLGMELFRRRFPALVATALLAGMTTHVMYSQEARVYSLQVLLVILSALYFFRSWKERRISPAFLLTTTLLTYSHSFSSWYFIACQGAFLLLAWAAWRDRDRFRKGFVSQLLVLLLWLPLVGAFVHARFARDIAVPTYWAAASEGLPGLFDLVEMYQGLAVRSWAGAAFMAILMLLAAGGLWSLWRPERREAVTHAGDDPAADPPSAQAVLFVLAWVVVPILFSLAVSVFTSLDTFGKIRYHMTVVPGLCLLAAAGAARVRTRSGRAAVAALVVLLPAAELPRFYTEHRQPAVDVAAEVIREEGRPGEPIFVSASFRGLAYYLRGSFPRIGSPEWERMAAEYAPLDDSYTMWGFKWGNTRAFEKIPPEIRFFGYWWPFVEDPQGQFAREEVARGHLDGAYWLVLRPQGDEPFVAALEELGVRCDDVEVRQVEALELRHCNPSAPAPPLLP